MRIIAGRLGGRKLNAKVSSETRPTADRVREAIGSVLTSRDAFEGASVLDLFAGTGALGLEALSRGALTLLAIDNDPTAQRCLESNVRALGVSDRVVRNKLDLFQQPERVVAQLAALQLTPFSLVFVDPPYRDQPRLRALLDALAESDLCTPGVLFVVEHARAVSLADNDALRGVGNYRYGDTAITLLARPEQMGEG